MVFVHVETTGKLSLQEDILKEIWSGVSKMKASLPRKISLNNVGSREVIIMAVRPLVLFTSLLFPHRDGWIQQACTWRRIEYLATLKRKNELRKIQGNFGIVMLCGLNKITREVEKTLLSYK